MPVAYSNGMAIGTPAPDFSLPATDGHTYTLKSFKDAKLLVVVFTCNHCPYAKACEERLLELQKDYASKGVQLVGINPNDAERYPDDSFEAMKARAKEKHYNFPYLRDESQAVARAYDAACTPDIFVFNANRKLIYNGRLDDNWKEPHKVERHDLRMVLDAALEDKSIPFEPVHSMGCSIKWKETS